MLNQTRPYSHVEQDLIWIGDYADGSHLSEYHLETKEKADFYSLQKSKLTRFGLIGRDHKAYYEVYGGFFVVNGQMYEIIYKVGDKEYYLTGQSTRYSDVIQFKDAESWANTNSQDERKFSSRITAFNFGYKTPLLIDGVRFTFKAICSFPVGGHMNMQVRLVADRDLDGQIIFKKNGTEMAKFAAPLAAGEGGGLMWVVR